MSPTGRAHAEGRGRRKKLLTATNERSERCGLRETIGEKRRHFLGDLAKAKKKTGTVGRARLSREEAVC